MSIPTPGSWCANAVTSNSQHASNTVPPTPTTLCNMGWRPLMLTGLLRDMLTRHFSSPLLIEDHDLRRLVWREDERTGILIESISRWRQTLVEKRPAVIIKANGRKNVRLGIEDAAGIDSQGNAQYQTFWVGSHTLFCIHSSGASTEILATEVQRELTQFHPVVTGQLGLLSWQVTDVGGLAELEEASESFVIPVTVAWTYTEKWKLSVESLRLRKLDLRVLLDGATIV